MPSQSPSPTFVKECDAETARLNPCRTAAVMAHRLRSTLFNPKEHVSRMAHKELTGPGNCSNLNVRSMAKQATKANMVNTVSDNQALTALGRHLSTPEQRLEAMGLELPGVPSAVGAYEPWVEVNGVNLHFGAAALDQRRDEIHRKIGRRVDCRRRIRVI